MNEFLTWWFVTHWGWATFCTPFATWMYAIYTGQVGWAWGSAIWWFAGRALHAAGHKDN